MDKPTFQIIKTRTITTDNIVKTADDYYRFVNHADKLVTTGFKAKDKLLEYSDMIRFDNGTLAIMQERYFNLFK